MCGCYRRGEASDPTTYTVAVATVLLGYDDAIIVDVTDPANGLPSKLQWLPAVAEVKAECERLKALRSPPQPRALPRPEREISEAERERVAAKMRALAAELGAGAAEAPPMGDGERALRDGDEARAVAIAQQGMIGVALSYEARVKMGLVEDAAEARG